MGDQDSVSRRGFLRIGTAAAAAVTWPALGSNEEKAGLPPAGDVPVVLPKRRLGRTGADVTMLGQGASFAISPRHLNMMHSVGIRYIDTAKSYQKGASERTVAEWLQQTGYRKDYFVVTKHEVREPGQWMAMIDERLEAMKTDSIDLFLLHGFGDSDYIGLDAAQKCLPDKEWAKAADRIRSSGKCRFLGFSTHTSPIEVRTGVLEAAARGSWVDAIMVAVDPTLIRENAAFNKALDACHQAGIGLISMKECMGGPKTIQDIFPTFKEKGLSAYTAVLSAMWTDERFACVCSHMDNFEKLHENATAAGNFKPLTPEELSAVHAMLQKGERRFCVACDGSCRRAGRTRADLNTIARYVSYAEEQGRVYEARELLTALPPEARDWSGADLAAASCACKCRLDFARIVARAEELLA